MVLAVCDARHLRPGAGPTPGPRADLEDVCAYAAFGQQTRCTYPGCSRSSAAAPWQSHARVIAGRARNPHVRARTGACGTFSSGTQAHESLRFVQTSSRDFTITRRACRRRTQISDPQPRSRQALSPRRLRDTRPASQLDADRASRDAPWRLVRTDTRSVNRIELRGHDALAGAALLHRPLAAGLLRCALLGRGDPSASTLLCHLRLPPGERPDRQHLTANQPRCRSRRASRAPG